MNDYIEYSVNYEDKVIDVGVSKCKCGKSEKTVLIIGGLNGTVKGFRNKYIRVGEMLSPYVNTVAINNPGPFSEEDYDLLGVGMDAVRNNFPLTEEVYFWGHSAGAYYGLRYCSKETYPGSGIKAYPEIRRLLFTNLPIKIIVFDKIMDALRKASDSPNIERLSFVYSEFDPYYDYKVKLSEPRYTKVNVHTAWGQNHEFSFSLSQFINLPQKYLLNDVIGDANEK